MKKADCMILFSLFTIASSAIFSAESLDIPSASENSEEIINVAQALCNFPTEHALSLRERSIEGADLAEKDLRFADLEGFNLDKADLHQSQIAMATAIRISLRRSNLSGAQMQFVNFFGGDLSGANVDGTDFSGANFNKTNLYGVDLTEAKLEGADLSFAFCQETPDLPLYIREIGCQFFDDKETLRKAGARFNEMPWTKTKEGAKLLNKIMQESRSVASQKKINVNDADLSPNEIMQESPTVASQKKINVNDADLSPSKILQESPTVGSQKKMKVDDTDSSPSKTLKNNKGSFGRGSSFGKHGSIGKHIKKLLGREGANDENSENGSLKRNRNSQGRTNNNSPSQPMEVPCSPESPKKEGDSLSKGSIPGFIPTNGSRNLSSPSNVKGTSNSRADYYKGKEDSQRRQSVIDLKWNPEENS